MFYFLDVVILVGLKLWLFLILRLQIRKNVLLYFSDLEKICLNSSDSDGSSSVSIYAVVVLVVTDNGGCW